MGMNDQEKAQRQQHEEAVWQQYLAVIKEAALKIDPETAEGFWNCGSQRDPYGLFKHGDDWEDCIGRNYWARSPGSEVWVEFGELPKATQDALWKKHKLRAAFSLPWAQGVERRCRDE